MRDTFVRRVLWPLFAILAYPVALFIGLLCLRRLAEAIDGSAYGADFGDVVSLMTSSPVEIAYFEMIQGAVIIVVALARLRIYRDRVYRLISAAACGAGLLILHYAAYRLAWRSMDNAAGVFPWWIRPLFDIACLLVAAWLLFLISNRLFAYKQPLWFSLASSGVSWIDGGALLLVMQMGLIFSVRGGDSVRLVFNW